ncbi:MAG TPA: hypothetical protein VNL14_12000 [Candidatus Acidoferrales bacterium]|nr:hypothetical protein [Candidatus Acidoferrales bacterium]
MHAAELLRYHPAFIEEAVFCCARQSREARRYQRERNRLYEIADIDQRDRAFQEFNLSWFKRLELAAPIEKAVGEQPLIGANVKWCAVARAAGRKEEGAELFVSPETSLSERERRSVAILLRPESLLAPEPLLTFLRHELFHIADMLDPSFGYEPSLPVAQRGPAHDALLKERYRALWDATINGRMVRRGWLDPSARAAELESFRRAFPAFGDETEAIFSRFFDQEPHTHAELLALASEPLSDRGYPASATKNPTRCPLCRFPTLDFESAGLDEETITEIRRDFPSWDPSRGLCIQCADLYRARRLSLAAARALPGAAART